MSHPSSLVDLCCAELGRSIATIGEVDEAVVDEKLRARILACAIAAGALDDEALTNANALSLFAGRELVLRGSRLTDRGLRLATAACAGRLLELDLSRCVGRVSDAGVTRLLRRSPALRRLNISHCRFTDASVECASQSCPQLVEIDFSWNGSGISDRSCHALAKRCGRLESLSMCGARVSDGALLALAAKCAALHTLRVRGCHMLSEGGIVAALSKLPRVSRVDLCQWPNASEASLERLVAHCDSLTALDLSMCSQLTDAAVAAATAGFPQLTELVAYGVPRLHSPLIASASLRRLCLSGCRSLAAPTLQAAELRTLELQNCRDLEPPALAAAVAGSPRLEVLSLDGSSRLASLELSSASLLDLSLGGCAKLETLSLSCASLERLSLRGCAAVTAAALDALLAGCPRLASLDVRACAMLDGARLSHAALADLTLAWCGALATARLDLPALRSLALLALPTPTPLPALLPPPAALASLHLHDLRGWVDQPPAALATRVSSLGALSLAGAPLAADDLAAVGTVLRHCGSLTSLDLSRCAGVCDGVLASLLPLCPHLLRFEASQLPRVASVALASPSLAEAVVGGCETLAELRIDCGALHSLHTAGSEKLRLVAVDAPALRELSLCSCAQLASLTLRAAALRTLDLSECVALDAADVERALPLCPSLDSLNLSGCRRLRALRLASPSLTTLRVCWCSALASLALACAGLRKLYAHGGLRLTHLELAPAPPTATVSALGKAAAAEAAVTTPATPTTPAAVNGAPPSPSCAGLQLLELQKCRALTDDSLPSLLCASGALRLLNLTDCALLRRPRLASASLVTVHLYNCLALVAPTIECASLELLNLTYCVAMSELTLRCPRLTTLLCAGCKALPDAAVLGALDGAAAVSSFDLKGCEQLAAQTLASVERHCKGALRVAAAQEAAAIGAVAASVAGVKRGRENSNVSEEL